MSRSLERLTVDALGDLPPVARTCLFWEYDAVRRALVGSDPARAEAEKAAWLSEVLREWGSCGQVLRIDGQVAGHAIYAPAAFLPGAAGFPTAPVSPDAVVLATAYVDPAHRGQGLGRVLVQGVARDLVRCGDVRAVEGFAATPGHERDCVLPMGYWAAVGFRTVREHRAHPRMRMDLRTALSWREEVETALERLLGAVRPVPKPRGQAGAQARAVLRR